LFGLNLNRNTVVIIVVVVVAAMAVVVIAAAAVLIVAAVAPEVCSPSNWFYYKHGHDSISLYFL
jgi:hypothetical protein